MAITKIMNIKSSKTGNAGSHLKNAIDYILKKDKVAISESGQRYVGSQSCIPDIAYKDMLRTKECYGKMYGRQGYHFVISFRPGEVTKEQLWNITNGFVSDYLRGYEAVYSMHGDTEHLHTHIIFNSVNYLTGYKYRYENGDWEKSIQPIVDRLCIENNAPVLEYNIDVEENEYIYSYSKNVSWIDSIRKDIDECISKSRSWADFIKHMKEKDYRFNFGKSISIRKTGMKRARRLKENTIGFAYTPEGIIERINFRNGKARINGDYRDRKKLLSSDIKRYAKFRKYKDMSFEDKVMVRQSLRIRNVIPAYQIYPGGFAANRKANELQRAAQELLVIKQYNVHSAYELDEVYKNLNSKEKEIKINDKLKDTLKKEAEKYLSAYQTMEDNANDEKGNLNKERAEKLIKEIPYSKDELEKIINDYDSDIRLSKDKLKDLKRQKAATKRIKEKYTDKADDINNKEKSKARKVEKEWKK